MKKRIYWLLLVVILSMSVITFEKVSNKLNESINVEYTNLDKIFFLLDASRDFTVKEYKGENIYTTITVKEIEGNTILADNDNTIIVKLNKTNKNIKEGDTIDIIGVVDYLDKSLIHNNDYISISQAEVLK